MPGVPARSGRGPDGVGSSPGHAVAGRGGGRGRTGAVLPALPDDAAPGTADGAYRAGVVVAASAGGGVVVGAQGCHCAGALRESCRTRRAAACCSPSGRQRSCVCRTRSRRRPARRRRRARRGLGSARGSRRSRPAVRRRDEAFGSLNSDRKIAPSGWRAHRILDLPLERLDLAASVLSVATSPSTICRRAPAPPRRPALRGARPSFASSSLGFWPPL